MCRRRRRRSSKRALALAGTLLAVAAGSSTSNVPNHPQRHAQHHIPRATRHVAYQSSNHHNSGPLHSSPPSSTLQEAYHNNKHSTYGTNNDAWTHVHADAALDPPDAVFARLRRETNEKSDDDTTTSSLSSSAVRRRSSEQRQTQEQSQGFHEMDDRQYLITGTIPPASDTATTSSRIATATLSPTDPPLAADAFVDESDGVTAVAADSNETAVAVGFNVSVDTEFNVTNDGNGNDTSTVIYTTNEENVMPTTENNINTTANSSSDTGGSTVTDEYDSSENIGDTDNHPPLHNSTNPNIGTNNDTDFDPEYRPIRMRAFLSDVAGGGQHLTESQQSTLLQQMIKPALLSWSAALRVIPVQGNLTVDSSQLRDGVACGPVLVPSAHTSTGVADTDFILYITVAFAESMVDYSNATDASDDEDSRERRKSSSENQVERTRRQLKGEQLDENADEENGSGLKDAANNDTGTTNDDHDDESTQQPSKPICTADYLAASSFCSTDQYDRPVAAVLHLCLTDTFFDDIRTNIMLVLHELGHSLGFNAVSLAHFRKPDGTPYTERNADGEIPLTTINCTGPVKQVRTDNVPLPSTDLLQFRTVRGGVRVAQVVTPWVRHVARNYFDCQDVSGAELESGEFVPQSNVTGVAAANQVSVSCLGDHWERRLFKTDLMNPLVDDNVEFNPRFSTITLAYFADSGWYQVDLSRTSLAAGWGRAAGCGFLDDTCIRDGQVPPQYDSFFCNQATSIEGAYTSDIHGCTPDLKRKASCALDSYAGELPPAYQYFDGAANVGGNDPFMDYCPVYSGFSNGMCADKDNEAVIRVNYVERFGQRNSRCLSGHVTTAWVGQASDDGNDRDKTLSPSMSSGDGEHDQQRNSSQSERTSTTTTALCLPIACVVEDRSLRIQVDGEWRVCRQQGDIIFLHLDRKSDDMAERVSIVCPDPIRTCPTFFCSRDCLGTNRICDYTVGRCVCKNEIGINKTADLLFQNYTGTIPVSSPLGGLLGRIEVGQDDLPCDDVVLPGKHGFYKPEDDKEDSVLPSADSPLADYYVPTARNLKEEPQVFWRKRWKGIASVSSAIACLFMALAGYAAWKRKRLAEGAGAQHNSNDGDGEINPDKHKMMASVVVDMRVNGRGRRASDILHTRDSETDVSMTDTESSRELSMLAFGLDAGFGTENEDNDLSGDPHTVVSRLGMEEKDGLYIDALAPPASTSPVVRRRHIPANWE